MSESHFKVKMVNGVPTLELNRLSPAKVTELVDILRRNFLYQQPQALARWEGADDAEPDFLVLRMLPGHWQRMMELIVEAGGWTLPPEDREQLEAEEAAQIGVLERNGSDGN